MSSQMLIPLLLYVWCILDRWTNRNRGPGRRACGNQRLCAGCSFACVKLCIGFLRKPPTQHAQNSS